MGNTTHNKIKVKYCNKRFETVNGCILLKALVLRPITEVKQKILGGPL